MSDGFGADRYGTDVLAKGWREAGRPVVPQVAAERDLVTQRFYRGRRDCDGAGLGLSLAKAIADMHGFALHFAEQVSAVSLVAPVART